MFLDVLPRGTSFESRPQVSRPLPGPAGGETVPSRSSWPFPVAANWLEAIRSDGTDTVVAMKADAYPGSSFVT